jgi:iron complex transport system ATP-binding protein
LDGPVNNDAARKYPPTDDRLPRAAAAGARPSTCPLSAHALTIGVAQRTLVRELSLDLAPGEFVAILGRNGSGKSLTLHTLAGLRPPTGGDVLMGGVPMHSLARRNIARRLGFLAQDLEDGFVTTAMESVLIGRHPHLSLWEWESEADEKVARESLAAVDLTDFSARLTDTLSGGERRRVAVASLLAQDPAIFLLDEPTNHLDPHHQLAVLSLFRELTRSGRTVLATLHDPTLATRFADRVILLTGEGGWKIGPVSEMTAESLSELYFTPMVELRQDGRRVFVPA